MILHKIEYTFKKIVIQHTIHNIILGPNQVLNGPWNEEWGYHTYVSEWRSSHLCITNYNQHYHLLLSGELQPLSILSIPSITLFSSLFEFWMGLGMRLTIHMYVSGGVAICVHNFNTIINTFTYCCLKDQPLTLPQQSRELLQLYWTHQHSP